MKLIFLLPLFLIFTAGSSTAAYAGTAEKVFQIEEMLSRLEPEDTIKDLIRLSVVDMEMVDLTYDEWAEYYRNSEKLKAKMVVIKRLIRFGGLQLSSTISQLLNCVPNGRGACVESAYGACVSDGYGGCRGVGRRSVTKRKSIDESTPSNIPLLTAIGLEINRPTR